MRGALLRSLAVFGIGAAVLAVILYYASTVDGRPPEVLRVVLTQHLSTDPSVALTTSSIEIDFSEPVEHAGAQAAFRIKPSVHGAFSWSSTAMTFTPSSRLPLRSSFAVHLEPGVRDGAGNAMLSASKPLTFETVGNPAVVATTPADGAQAVALDVLIEIEFSTLMDTTSVERVLTITPATPLELRWRGERLTIQPSEPLLPNREYTVRVGTDARDQAGTPLEAPYLLSFETVKSGLGTVALVPAVGVQGIAVTSPIAVLFDRPLDPRSVSGDLLTITPSPAGSFEVVAAPGAAGLAGEGLRLLRFQPSGPLEANTTYEVELAAGLQGADGSRMVHPLTWRFTTGAPSDAMSNQVVFLSDRAGIANLWAMNPDGTNQRQLSAELSPVVDYAVAPDGRSFLVGDGASLVLMNADGSDRRVLTEAGLIEFDPTFSPDGALMAFGRADPGTGNGLGIWTRFANGGDPRAVELLAAVGATPTPSPSPRGSAGELRVPLLRAPLFSPDGARLAFIDDGGRLEIVDLATRRHLSVKLDAVTPPIWLPDSSGVLLTALPDLSSAVARLLPAGRAVMPLDPARLGLSADRIAALQVVRVSARDGTAVILASLGAGAARPAVDDSGRYAYLVLDATDPRGGRLWVTSAGAGAASALLRDGAVREASAFFAPPPGVLVVGRIPLAGATAGPLDGVWLVDLATGLGTQLAVDGWLPRWLP